MLLAALLVTLTIAAGAVCLLVALLREQDRTSRERARVERYRIWAHAEAGRARELQSILDAERDLLEDAYRRRNDTATTTRAAA